MDDAEPVVTRIRCPKCASADLTFVEISTWETTWDVKGGKFDLNERFGNPGHIDRVNAECNKCAHGWKPRGAYQIDDVCEPAT